MKDHILVIDTLKELLKAKGMTYHQLSKAINISEASVKRIFSNYTFTIDRIEQICEHLEVTLFDLFEIASQKNNEDVYEYSLEQEIFFVKNPHYLAFFDFLLKGRTVNSILNRFNLSARQAEVYLAKLDSLALIECLGQNKYKLLCGKNVKWRNDGPLKRAYFDKAKYEFLNSRFQSPQSFINFSILSLSKESRKKLETELKEIYRKYDRASKLESRLDVPTQSIGILFASREWNFSILEYLENETKHKK